MSLWNKLSRLLLALSLTIPSTTWAAPAQTGQQVILNRALDHAWELANASRLDEALSTIYAVHKLTDDPEQLARLNAMITVCTTLRQTTSAPTLARAVERVWDLANSGQVDEALAVIDAVGRLTGDPRQAERLEAMRVICATLKGAPISSFPTRSHTPPAPTASPQAVPSPIAQTPVPVPMPSASYDPPPRRAPGSAQPGYVVPPSGAARQAHRAESARATPAEPATPAPQPPTTTAARHEPVRPWPAAHAEPADKARGVTNHVHAAAPDPFKELLNKAKALARDGRKTETAHLLEQEGRKFTAPEQRVLIQTLANIYTRPEATPPAQPAEPPPDPFDELLKEAKALARDGRKADAAKLLEEKGGRFVEPEQKALIRTLASVYGAPDQKQAVPQPPEPQANPFDELLKQAKALARDGRKSDAARLIEERGGTFAEPEQKALIRTLASVYGAPEEEPADPFDELIKQAKALAREGRKADAARLLQEKGGKFLEPEQKALIRTLASVYGAPEEGTEAPAVEPLTQTFDEMLTEINCLVRDGRKADAVALLRVAGGQSTDPGQAALIRTLTNIHAPPPAPATGEFGDLLDSAWEMAQSGRLDDALATVRRTRLSTSDPDQIAQLDALVDTFTTIRDTAATDTPAASGSATLVPPVDTAPAEPGIMLTPEELDKRIARARELARQGSKREAAALLRQAARQTDDPEQIAFMKTLTRVYADAAGESPGPPVHVPVAAPLPTYVPMGVSEKLWSDQRFRELFVGTYAMNAAVEPEISDDEKRLLAIMLDDMSNGKADRVLATVERLFQQFPPSLEELGVITNAMEKYEAERQAAEARAAEARAAAEAKAAAEAEPGKVAPSLYGSVKSLLGDKKHLHGGSTYSVAAEDLEETPEVEVEAVEIEPPRTVLDSPSATFAQIAGNICFQKGNMDDAVEWFKFAIARFPSFMRAYKNLGMVEVQRGNFKEAAPALTRALELGSNDALLHGLLAYSHTSMGNHLAAEVGYRAAVLLQPTNADWKMGLARALFGQSRFADAVAVCDQLIAEKPGEPDLWRLQAKAFLALGQTVKAARNYEYLRVMGEADPESLNTLGDIYVKTEASSAAAEAYQAALASASDQPLDPYVQKAKFLARSNASEDAHQLLAAVENAASGGLTTEQRKEILRIRAWIALKSGSDAEQARYLEEIVQLDPMDGEALISLGRYHARVGNPERAAFCYERAVGIARVEAKARIYHAQLLVQQSKYQEAIPMLKSALLIEHRDDVAAYLKQVEAAATSKR